MLQKYHKYHWLNIRSINQMLIIDQDVIKMDLHALFIDEDYDIYSLCKCQNLYEFHLWISLSVKW